MRITPNSLISDLWSSGGPFIGEDAEPHGRVTVEIGWELRKSLTSAPGGWDRGPARWFQRSDNSQVETEIPNIKTIAINRSIDTDAATCTIVLVNQKMLTNGETEIQGTAGGNLGQPGYYWFGRGDSTEATTLWGWTQNEWNDILQPNALLRVWQGYGGKSKTIDQAVADGNLLQTGLWLVDDVTVDAQTGNLTINCRDMAKLLIEQMIYPPLIPTVPTTAASAIHGAHYPLYYYRWVYVQHPVIPYGNTVYHTGFIGTEGALTLLHATSDAAAHPGGYTDVDPIQNHRSSDSIDGTDPETYWLSSGHLTGDTGADMEWIEFHIVDAVQGVNIQPYAGNYRAYLSVMINGVWQGANTIPYTGSQYTGIYNPAVPYVTVVGIGWETPGTFDLNGTYTPSGADNRIRVTFSNLAKTSVAPLYYRCGIRDISAGTYSATITSGGKIATGMARGFGDADHGYWICGSDGGVFTWGNLKFLGSRGAQAENALTVGMQSDDLGTGYRLVGADGGVFTFGTVPYKGSLPGLGVVRTNVVAIASGDQWTDTDPTGGHNGYYILTAVGEIFAFGNAIGHGNSDGSGGGCVGMAVRPDGYWIAHADGTIGAHGTAAIEVPSTVAPVDYPTHHLVGIQITATGNGYWACAEDGAVYSYGDAVYYGRVFPPLNGNIIGMAVEPTGHGYWLLGEDGGVFVPENGDQPNQAHFWGSLPVQFTRIDEGNYLDYCLDVETEILTKRGWMKWDTISDKDEVLGINVETGSGTWQNIESIYYANRKREMIKMSGASFDSVTTPDHRWLVQFGEDKRWRWTTSDALRTTDRIPLKVPPGYLPTIDVFTDDFVEFVAWFYTEGWWHNGSGATSQSVIKNPKNCESIERCMTALYGNPGPMTRGRRMPGRNGPSWRIYEKQNGMRIYNFSADVADEMRKWVDQEKVVSEQFLYLLTAHQLDLFIETSMKADGHRPSRNLGCFSQRSERRVKAFEIAAILAGRPFVTHKYKNEGGDFWSLHFLKTDYMAPVRSATKTGRARIERIEYDGIIWCPTVQYGNFVARRNGSVYVTGNSDIVSDLLLWSGWWRYQPSLGENSPPEVYGNLESTGIYAPTNLTEDFFDKKPVIDVINTLKEIVGYYNWADEIGAYHWQSPNTFSIGNFLENGVPTLIIPVIDEKLQITAYSVNISDKDARSTIIVATSDPQVGLSDTKSVTITSQWGADLLRGIVRPAMWVNGQFLTTEIQNTMAQLIDIQLFLQQRQGTLTMPANPLLQIDDQVQIFERTTSETYVHYIRGYSTQMDLESGAYTQQLTTHWMGDGTNFWWAPAPPLVE